MLTNLFAPALLYLYRRLGIISNINQDLNKWPGDQGENYLLRLELTSHLTWKPGAQLKTQRDHTERQDAELGSHYKTPGPAFKRILYQPVIETHLIFSALK